MFGPWEMDGCPVSPSGSASSASGDYASNDSGVMENVDFYVFGTLTNEANISII